jgi:hypothetical protein
MQFDPAAFLDVPVEEVLVKRPPIDVGDYVATIKDVTAAAWASKSKVDEKTGALKSGLKYDLTLTVEVPDSVRERIGLDKTTIELRDGIMLELNSGGGIDTAPGKNGALRRWRDATDLNKPGVPFTARQFIGKMVMLKIAHREYPEGSGDLVEQISGIGRIG